MLVVWQSKIGMNLIGNHKNTIALANFSNPLQIRLRPDCSARIMRIGKQHHLASFCLLFEVIEINLETTIHKNQLIGNKLTSIIYWQVNKRRIHRRIDQNPVTRLSKRLNAKCYSDNDSGNIMQFVSFCLDRIMSGQPINHSAKIRFIAKCIAKKTLVATLPDCIKHAFGCFEIHIGNPHRQKVISSEKRFHQIVLHTRTSLTREHLIEVIFHHFLSFSF